jgi:hypothetical protein
MTSSIRTLQFRSMLLHILKLKREKKISLEQKIKILQLGFSFLKKKNMALAMDFLFTPGTKPPVIKIPSNSERCKIIF